MKSIVKEKLKRKLRRAKRTRSNIQGTAERPRMSVSRSAKHISVQLINDLEGKTIVFATDHAIDAKGKKPIDIATIVGTDIAKKAIDAGIKSVIFDRGSFKYHGRVKALADGARDGGLEF